MNRSWSLPPVRFVPASDLARQVPLVQTGQIGIPVPTSPPSPGAEATEQHNFFDALRGVTPALIATGIAIGIASGIGTTIGSTLGTLLLERFHLPKQRKSSR